MDFVIVRNVLHKEGKKEIHQKPNADNFPVNILKNEMYRLQTNCRPEVPTLDVLI